MTINGQAGKVEEAARIFRKVLEDPTMKSRTLEFFHTDQTGRRTNILVNFENPSEMRGFYKAVADLI